MPIIIVDPDMVDEIEEIAKRAFGSCGVLPLKPGSTEIIPTNGGKEWIEIFLHKKEERDEEVLSQIWAVFAENTKKYGVSVIAQPEKLWRKI